MGGCGYPVYSWEFSTTTSARTSVPLWKQLVVFEGVTFLDSRNAFSAGKTVARIGKRHSFGGAGRPDLPRWCAARISDDGADRADFRRWQAGPGHAVVENVVRTHRSQTLSTRKSAQFTLEWDVPYFVWGPTRTRLREPEGEFRIL